MRLTSTAESGTLVCAGGYEKLRCSVSSHLSHARARQFFLPASKNIPARLQKKGEKAPSVVAGMQRPLCLTNICSSEYAVFCGEQEVTGVCPTSKRARSASYTSSPCMVSPRRDSRSVRRCGRRPDAGGGTWSGCTRRPETRGGG